MPRPTPLFQDRHDAGRQLAHKLSEYANRPDAIVLGLPRGGVPVAYEVAIELRLPLDVFIVRKLGVPGHEELAMGAIASSDVSVINQGVIQELGISRAQIDAVMQREREELQRRERAYRGDRPPLQVEGKHAILVDDGLATGASMYAAVLALRQRNPVSIIVAVPTAAPETCAAFEKAVEAIVCAHTPQPFLGVGMWYADFSQTTDEEVRELLHKTAERRLERNAWD